MKKLILILVVTLSCMTIVGQTKKGNFVISGGTGIQFTSSSTKDVYDGATDSEYTTNTFSIMPSGAYFVIDNLAVGLASNFSFSGVKYEDGDKNNTTTVLLLPVAMYYFPVEGNIRPLVQLGIGLSSLGNKDIPKTGSERKYSYSGLAINIGGGIAYFVKENTSFNVGLSYTKTTMTDSDDTKYKIKQGNFGLNVGIAVYF
jgi:outer membrane protein